MALEFAAAGSQSGAEAAELLWDGVGMVSSGEFLAIRSCPNRCGVSEQNLCSEPRLFLVLGLPRCSPQDGNLPSQSYLPSLPTLPSLLRLLLPRSLHTSQCSSCVRPSEVKTLPYVPVSPGIVSGTGRTSWKRQENAVFNPESPAVKSFANIPCGEFFSSVRRLNIPWAGGVRDELGIAAQG